VGNATTIGNDKVVSVMIADANVTTAKIADANVTTAKIADTNVTTAKIADANVTTAKIADTNVTNAKLDKANIPLSGFGAATADVDLGTKKLTDVADPTAAQDAATKAYVDAEIAAGTATNVSGIVAVVNGGTGAATVSAARNNLGLYTGVHSKTVNGAAITIPFGDILPVGITPTTSSMIMFFSNTGPVLIMRAFLYDTNLDSTNDAFWLDFNSTFNGTIKISYYIAI
jgi:hypothetical protein